MFIIVLGQHVSIVTDSSLEGPEDDSIRIETCCPNTIIDILKFCYVEYIIVYLYRVSQEEMSIFCEVIVSVILSKNVYMNMCPIPNGFPERAI